MLDINQTVYYTKFKENKMKSAIEDMLFADLRLDKSVKKFTKNSEALKELIKCDEQLTALLKKNPKNLELFEKFKKVSDEYDAEETVEYYKAGFRSGFWLAFDLMQEE